MARPLRIEYPGAVYHVTSRGNARNKIFKNNDDREAFLEVMAAAVKRFNWLCHSYCLMDNHYHLIVETPDGNLGRGMRHLNGVYTQTYNRRHKKTGHVFQGRYKAIVVEKESHLAELCRYVVLNPVRAKITSAPEQWQWSSYLPTIGEQMIPEYLTTDWILGQFGTGRAEAQRKYKEFVHAGIAGPAPWEKSHGQILLGGDKFISDHRTRIADKEKINEITREQRYIGRPLLEGILSKDEGESENIYEAYSRYGYTLKEIAEFLGIHYTTVSRKVKAIESEM